MSCWETDRRLVIWTAQTKSIKFWSLDFWSSDASSPPQSLIRVIGRCMAQITLQLFELSFPCVAVPQLRGASVTQEGSSVRAMLAQMASMMSFPRTAPDLELTFPFCRESAGGREFSSTCQNIQWNLLCHAHAHTHAAAAAYSSSFVRSLLSLSSVIWQ